jgi:hypothetical protein
MDYFRQINKNKPCRNQKLFHAARWRAKPTGNIVNWPEKRCFACNRRGKLHEVRGPNGFQEFLGGRCVKYLCFLNECLESGRMPFRSYFNLVSDADIERYA